MSGDYSRWSFDPQRHFGALFMQQGRVHTDADWNEWVTTILRRVQAASLDTLGRAVVPRETPDGFRIEAANGTLAIGRGRIYVDGLLAENHGGDPAEWDPRLAELRGTTPTPYDDQPYYPDPPALPGGGPHLVYLKVWQRELTAIEEPALVEKALGVDTTTRLQTVWQAKLLPEISNAVTCATPLDDVPGFLDAEPAAAGRLTTGTADVPGQPDPCLIPPSGGYKGLENQLYRVEIHRGGDFAGADQATFKWSRDNATVASRVTEIPALDRVVVESVRRDEVLGFSDGDWVEITDDWRELSGVPGELRRIQTGGGVDDETRTIRLTAPLPAGMFPVDAQGATAPERNTRVSRWDQGGRVLDANGNLLVDLDAPGSDGSIPVPAAPTRVLLEHGVAVSFDLDPGTGRLRSGDHWLFAARTADASVEALDQAPPRGIHAHYAKLAIVTFPSTETDCRTLWPPELHEGGCDCTVCVSPESHASGALTIQAAIEQVKETGGTVCLGAGTYPLRTPLTIHDARSVRLRGQGWATALIATESGTAIDVRRGIGVTIENLSAVTSSPEGVADAITLGNCLGVAVERCFVLNHPVGDGRGAAIGLEGFLIGARVEECVLAGPTGIAGGVRDDRYLATASLRVDSNWLWCRDRGIELGRFGIHVADSRISRNTIWGCREAGLIAEGGNVRGPFGVTDNALNVRGPGIAVGVDAARVAENDVDGDEGDGIVLVPGLDPGGIDHCQVLGNRVRGMDGHAIAIRTRVNSGMIKHNVLATTGGGGVVMEGDGSAVLLVVENNQLTDVGQRDVEDGQVTAMRFVAVDELDVSGNAVHRFAARTRQAVSRSAILAVGAGSARIDGNRLVGIGPAEGFLGRTAGIELVMPFQSASLAGNTVRRRGNDRDKLARATWIGILVRGGRAVRPETLPDERSFVALGDVAVLELDPVLVVFTSTKAFVIARAPFGDVAARGNEVVAESSAAPPLLVSAAQVCLLAENRLRGDEPRTGASVAHCQRAIVSGNDLRAFDDEDVLEIQLGGKDEAAILGNLRTGEILLNGAPLGDPWAPLNPLTL